MEIIKRVPNFTPSEKIFLLNLISAKASIIEDKKTNRVSMEEKAQVWKNIESEFNANASIACYRSADSLKRFYENRKKELRRKLAEDKKQRFLTGGGPAPIVKLDDTDEIILSIVSEKTVKGLVVPYDSDADYEPLKKAKKTDDDSALVFTFTNDTKSVKNVPNMESTNFVLTQEYVTEADSKVPNQQSSQQFKNLKIPKKTVFLSSYQSSKTFPAKEVASDNEVQMFMEENTEILNDGVEERDQTEGKTKNWKNYKTTDFQSPPNKVLKSKSRRRPTNSVKILTSSHIGEKYNILLDKRLTLVQKNIEQATEQSNFQAQEHKLKLETLGKEKDIKELEQKEKVLKIELLKLDIAYKKALLSNN